MLQTLDREVTKNVEHKNCFYNSALSRSRCQFHQHFDFFCQNLTREKLCEALSYKKRACKMLMKLTQVIQVYIVLKSLNQS